MTAVTVETAENAPVGQEYEASDTARRNRIRDLQQIAAYTLADLLKKKLPVCWWSVSDVYPGRLSGQVARPEHGRTLDDLVADWAEFLDVTPEWSVSADGKAMCRLFGHHLGAEIDVIAQRSEPPVSVSAQQDGDDHA